MLPQNWDIELADLNVHPLSDEQWNNADIICTGGMLPQQGGILALVERAKAEGKYVVVGGPDPTSQPALYHQANAKVLGEGERSIPLWLESWKNGEPNGTFETKETTDISTTPVPRFDLISFNDYLYVGLQTSRGCPYNCEFCDVIELFGRKPRVKGPEQFVKELDRLYELGYRGWIDIADDNFIGNRLKTKPVLAEIANWQSKRKYPFIFSTEASVNLADDDELLGLMRESQFRYVFLGIETPDQRVLSQTQKKINTVKPLIDRVHRIYDFGISVTAGFILGFDSEPDDCDDALIDFIQESGIMLAMVGLLVALPNTQLTKRLAKERRLISSDHKWLKNSNETYFLESGTHDQTGGGLNFITVRDRAEIYRQLHRVITEVYAPKAFMDRVLYVTSRIKLQSKHSWGGWEYRRMLRGFVYLSWQLLKRKDTRWLFLRNCWKSLWMGRPQFDFANQLMGSYLHFSKQTDLIRKQLEVSIKYENEQTNYPRSVSEMNLPIQESLPIVTCEPNPKIKIAVQTASVSG